MYGSVSISDLATAMAAARQLPNVTLFAMDGTLLNLLRWGSIVNDNDIDLGFAVDGVPVTEYDQHYELMQRILINAGFQMEAKPLNGSKNGSVLFPGYCLKRRGLKKFLCRHRNGVHYDIYGPDAIFGSSSNIDPDDVFETQPCKCWNFTFECPRRALHVLQSWSHPGWGISPSRRDDLVDRILRTWGNPAFVRRLGPRTFSPVREFSECVVFPIDPTERTEPYLQEILNFLKALDSCGFPSLSEAVSNPECKNLTIGLR